MDGGQHENIIERSVNTAKDYIEKTVSHQVKHHHSRELRFQNDLAHLVPSRWWFASSAFPMIAATLGPVASAFSICALGSQWRLHVAPGKSIDEATFVKDPSWLTIVNAIQLVMALVSNAFLLLNMTKRVRFSIAQPVTIVGWYMSAICLLALDATAAGPLLKGLNPPQDYVWSQAFFYGIWASILYFVVASLMLVTFWGASTRHYPKDFNLTRSQRTLMLQTIMFLMYLLLGALIFAEIEGWHYLDAVYWANVTMFTIGFGDFVTSTPLARALLIPYAFVGVISLGLVISSIRSMILERGRRRLDARMEEKNRRRIIRAMTKRGRDDILRPIDSSSTSNWEAGSSSELPHNEFDRRRTEFLLMRKIQQQASVRRKWMALIISGSVWLLLWLVGAVIFMHCEQPYQQWTYFEAFYFCFVSFTTIGYGDRTPKSNPGKSFFVFWSLLALPTVTILISNAGDTVVKFVRDATIHLGNITILPGEEGFTGNVKYALYRLSFGRLFRDATKVIRQLEMEKKHGQGVADVAGLGLDSVGMKERQKRVESESSGSAVSTSLAQGTNGQDASHGSHKNLKPDPVPAGRPSLTRVRDRLDELPEGIDLQLLLVKEIQLVAQHLKKSKPRRYTFDEWAWYLGLIGEDERDPENHRKVVPKKKNKRGSRKKKRRKADDSDAGQEAPEQPSVLEASLQDAPPGALEAATELGYDHDRLKWSWVGVRSPLVGSQEESEWILEKLMERLQESLWETKVDEEDGQEGG